MYSDISVQIVSLVYIIIFSIVYFSKRKYNFLESRVYKLILLFTIITLLLDITSTYLIEGNTKYIIFSYITVKFYYMSLFTFIILFVSYILLNRTDVKYDTYTDVFNKSILGKVWIIIAIILGLAMIVLPVEYSTMPVKYYGMGPIFVYALAIIGSLVLTLLLLFKIKNLPNYKSLSTLFSVIILTFTIHWGVQWKK